MSPAPVAPVALVGSGEFLPVMEPLDSELLAGRPKRAVFLPTAAAPEGPERLRYWVRLGDAHFRRLGVEPVPLLVTDRASAESEELAAAVAGAGLVYLSGGNPGYLADTLRSTLVLDAILIAWSKGAALAGCSAGACALTAVAEDVTARATRPGLGVVPHLVVVPHFDRIERWAPGIVDRHRDGLRPGQILLGIDENTAVAGGPERWTVHGDASIWLIGRDGERRAYPAGTTLDLSAAR